mmetsp:Transcript_94473/g.272098  ORF Transcript_94473/g.272098 Transcript_94473/m.272098 type:complete len:355 (+) Transcript_94473:534-1598(+)
MLTQRDERQTSSNIPLWNELHKKVQVDGYPERTGVSVNHMPTPYRIYIPKAWAQQLLPGSIEPLGGSSYNAKLACAPGVAVQLKVVEDFMLKSVITSPRIHSIEGFVNKIALAASQSTAYMLSEAEDGSLLDYMRPKMRAMPRGSPLMPYRVSLPLLVDMLRGVMLLNDAGILAVLTERNLGMKNGRVVFSNFESTTVAVSPSTSVSLSGHTLSAAREAPELNMVFPKTWATSNTWSIGLIFAAMCTGRSPTERYIEKRFPQVSKAFGTKAGDNQVRDIIRWHFSVFFDDDVKQLEDEKIKELINGMLREEPEKRWTVEEALQFTLELAKDRGIEVPSQPWSPMRLPDGRSAEA